MTNHEKLPNQGDASNDGPTAGVSSDLTAHYLRRLTEGFGLQPPTPATDSPDNTPENNPHPPLQPLRVAEIGHPETVFWFESQPANGREQQMAWSGVLSEVIANLEEQIKNEGFPGGPWHAARLVRGILDSTVIGTGKVALVNETTRFAMELYAGTPNPERLDAIRDALGGRGMHSMIIVQEYDRHTDNATIPDHSRTTAERLAQKIDDPLLIIPLCHGGLVAGTQAALLLQRSKPKQDIVLYPVRYSRRKRHDSRPQLTDYEMLYLQDLSKDRTVIVLDEDTGTGASITQAVRYFSGVLGANQVLGIANNDYRDNIWVSLQGAWWEKAHD